MTPLEDRDPVDVLAEEFADRLRRGEYPSVSDYAVNHPQHADQLRELLPAVAQMEYLKRFRRGTDECRLKQLPDRFGDFRIVRELGRGGMGVVFEAVQESLGRPVALKVLAMHAQLDDTRRARFIREAQAAAKLHHTNIVPVFGVGEQDGIPYYVMQLIRGEGLHSVVQRWRLEQGKDSVQAGSTMEYGQGDTRPTEPIPEPVYAGQPSPRYGDWGFVANIGFQAADALHYAHKQGVLHRDVKPANLILDPARRVWVTDFGLAKLLNTHGLTATGDILGTLQYLAPECLLGDSDPRSDVYGLGATLYELLTLLPPYPMESPARLVKHMADADPIPPRQLNKNIPRDLETIVLKAMAREPNRRYVSPRELANDLRAFLEDRPITARRETWMSRTWRWCRRNPTVAILGTSMVAAFVLAGVLGGVGYANTKKALHAEGQRRQEAEQARADADKARNDAEQLSGKIEVNLKLSLDAFEKVFEAAASTRQGGYVGPGGRPLNSPGGYGAPGGFGTPGGRGGAGAYPMMIPVPYGGPLFLGGPGGGPPPGPNGGPMGEAAAKAAVLEAILGFYDKFSERNSTNPRLQLESARARRRVGDLQSMMGQTDKAHESFRRATESLEKLHQSDPQNEQIRIEFARALLLTPTSALGNRAEEKLQQAMALMSDSESGVNKLLIGSIWLRIGTIREENEDMPGAKEALRAAVAALAIPVGEESRFPPPRVDELAFARWRLANVLLKVDQNQEARELLEDSIAGLRRAQNPFGPGPKPQRDLLMGTLFLHAEACDRLGDSSAANRSRAEANSIMSSPGDGPFGGPKKDGPKKEGPPRKN